MTLPNHPGSPEFEDHRRALNLGPEDCEWVAVRNVVGVNEPEKTIPLNSAREVKNEIEVAGHHSRLVTVTGSELGSLACLTCSTCEQVVVIRGPKGNQAAGMDGTGKRRRCLIWRGLAEYPNSGPGRTIGFQSSNPS